MHASHPLNSEDFRQFGQTLPGRLLMFARQWPNRCALREKCRGLWREVSWADYLRHTLEFAMALRALGVQPGERAAVISDNCPEWLYADLGTQMIGAVAAGIYTTNPPSDVAYVLNHSQAKVLVCEDQEQVDKVLDWAEELPHLQRIVVIDPAGTASYCDARLCTWDEFVSSGRAAARAMSLDDLAAQLGQLDPSLPSVLVYTSGTTGTPKGALMSAEAMLALSRTYLEELGGCSEDTLLSYLPLCHVAEKIFTEFNPLTTGAVVHFGESLETIRQDLVEVAPTVFLGVPRIWEKIRAGVDVAIRNSSGLKRHLYQWAVVQGRQRFEASLGNGPNLALRLRYRMAEWLVLRALRERLGLGRCRLPVSGAAPIAPDLLVWFHWIGVPILEGWGLTETCGIATLNRPAAFRLGTVGQAATGVACRLADDGEILVRGPQLFSGYLDNPEATAEALDAEGWLHTGDLGRFDEQAYLSIVGRKKEILITAGGKNLAPAKIENALKTSAYIKEAATVADAKPFVSALIQIEPDMVGDWALRQGIAFTSFADLSARPEVVDLIEAEVAIANQQLARAEQVRGFRLLPKELHQDDGEVTATQKLKRGAVVDKFSDLVDDIYDERRARSA